MERRAIALLGLVALTVGLGGCGTRWLNGGVVLLTAADERAINETGIRADSLQGRVTPTHIRCAEPSPDVAKAISSSFGGSLSAVVRGLPSGVAPEVAAAVSRSQAEAIVQMTERLATIQLLRDGLHRACEAYANGAISDTAYAVMLSRFDKTMVTMLLGELAAGAFGRSLAGASTGAEGMAKASLDVADKQLQTREAEANLKSSMERKKEAEGKADEADRAAKAKPGDANATKTADEAKRNLEQSQKEVTKAERDLKDALKAETTSAAKALELRTVGGIAAANNPEIARALTDLARKYLENIHFDALEVACLSALDRPRAGGITEFGEQCKGSLIPALQTQKREILDAVVKRAQYERDRAHIERERAAEIASMKGNVAASQEYIKQVETLMADLDRLRGKK